MNRIGIIPGDGSGGGNIYAPGMSYEERESWVAYLDDMSKQIAEQMHEEGFPKSRVVISSVDKVPGA